MSSGRDIYLENWRQVSNNDPVFKPKTHLERMLDYKETLLAELERLEHHIKELQDEQ